MSKESDNNQAFQNVLARMADRYKSRGVGSNPPGALVPVEEILIILQALKQGCIKSQRNDTITDESMADMSLELAILAAIMVLVLESKYSGKDG